mgnify:FL=1
MSSIKQTEVSEADYANLYPARTLGGKKKRKKTEETPMPLTLPRSGETEKNFIARCSGNPTMNEEFPDAAQRVAVCYSQWRKAKKSVDDSYRGISLFMPPITGEEDMLKKSFDPNKPLETATLGEYAEAMHTSFKPENPFRLLIEQFLEQPFNKCVRLTEGFPRYRANLLRYAIKKVVPVGQIVSLTNYSYDEEIPVDYCSFSTGTETVDGIVTGVLCIARSFEKIVLRVDEDYDGNVNCSLYGTQKEHLLRFLEFLKEGMAANNFLKGKKLFANGSFINPGKFTWSDIVLPAGFRQKIEKHVIQFLTKMDEMRAKGLPTKRGLLIYGEVGNGKSSIGKVIANEVPCSFIWVPFSADISHVYSMARELAPTVVFLEDLATQGGMNRRSGVSNSQLGRLLNLLDGIEENTGVVTVATENLVGNLDVALRNRPGRFDVILHLGNPAFQQREEYLHRYLPTIAAGRVRTLAQATDGFSCAHLRELVNRMIIEDFSPDMDESIILDMRETFAVGERSETFDDE